jgi:O-phospho-L-seryl-tRNASec:L-selenocysteinyl-tRNA synthase
MSSTRFTALADRLVGDGYVIQAAQAAQQRANQLDLLFEHRRIPNVGWDDLTIELLLLHVAQLDSNNFAANAGVGEREARCFSHIVRSRHFHLGHGVGRSGDLGASQPKAAGSSALAALTEKMALHAIRLSGVAAANACLVLPLATGMALVMALLTLKSHFDRLQYQIPGNAKRASSTVAGDQTTTTNHQPAALASQPTATTTEVSATARAITTTTATTTTSVTASDAASSVALASSSSSKPNRQYVIWPRIDQKTCLKSILTAGPTNTTGTCYYNVTVGTTLNSLDCIGSRS